MFTLINTFASFIWRSKEDKNYFEMPYNFYVYSFLHLISMILDYVIIMNFLGKFKGN